MTNGKTKSQLSALEAAALLRARNPLLVAVTKEEARAERYLIEAAAAAGYKARMWDCAQGVTGIDGKVDTEFKNAADADTILDVIRNRTSEKDRCVWILRDLTPWLSGPVAMPTVRKLRNLCRMLPGVPNDRAQAIVMLSASSDLPPELAGHATVIDWPMPDRAELGAILDATVKPYTDEQIEKPKNGTREAAIEAAIGLSGLEAQAFYSKSLVEKNKIDPIMVGKEKKRVISRDRGLEWYDPLPGGLAAVGGLDNLKRYLIERKLAYTPEARAYGLPLPRGLFLAGISGCGKTYISKAIAANWECPLIRWDPNAGKSKFLGESETNFRNTQKTIETVGKCVVLVDEIEKAFAGATGGGAADAGVAADALGSFLTWMQERTGEAYVVATANDISGLPPELLRKGRFDEIFFVDLPNENERKEILAATLKTYKRDATDIDLAAVAEKSKDFNGAEIASLVPDAMFFAFNDGARKLETSDLLRAAGNVVPLAETAAEKIRDLRKWAKGRARPATGNVIEIVRPDNEIRVDL